MAASGLYPTMNMPGYRPLTAIERVLKKEAAGILEENRYDTATTTI